MTSKHTMSGVKPLDLSNLLRHAFMSGAGYGAGDRISDFDVQRWVEYNPEGLKPYERICAALAPSDAEPVGYLISRDGKLDADPFSRQKLTDADKAAGFTEEPLYTHPDSSSEAVRALEAIAEYATIPAGDWRRKYPELARLISNAKETDQIVEAIYTYAQCALNTIKGGVKK